MCAAADSFHATRAVARRGRTGVRCRTVQVPIGHISVEGDNAEISNDSNSFGPVPTGLVQAQVRCKIWPPPEASFIRRQPPSRERVIATGDHVRPSAWS